MAELISPEHKTFVLGVIFKHFSEAKVTAFGSRIRGDAKQYSDLDLSITLPQGQEKLATFSKLALLDEELANSDLPFKVDIVLHHNLSEKFRTLVERTGVIWSRIIGRR